MILLQEPSTLLHYFDANRNLTNEHLGTLGLLWCVLWFFVGYSEPGQHPRISEQEKKYIQSSLQTEPQDIQVKYKTHIYLLFCLCF